jgi:hypothetical protein
MPILSAQSERETGPHRSAPSSVPAARNSARRPAADARTFARMQRAIRKASSGAAGNGRATGATVLRFRAAPLATLIEKSRIGGEEVRAAGDMTTAFHAQAGAAMIKSPSLEKLDAASHDREPFRIIDAVSRYKPWARFWSQRARLGDRTLEIVVAAVIDERAFHVIEADAGIRHGMAARVTIAGLRDYAARAGWTDRITGDAWIREAEAIFKLRRRRNV